VSCNDLQTLASFGSTLSVSSNARVFSDQAPLTDTTPVTSPEPPPVDPSPAPPVDVPPAPPADVIPAPPVDPPTPMDERAAEGEAAAALQTPMLQTLLGDNFAQIRAQQPAVTMGIAVID